MNKPKHRAETAADRLSKIFEEASERNKVKYKDREQDHCVEYDDGLDGYVIHTAQCPYYQDLAISGSNCINFTRAR